VIQKDWTSQLCDGSFAAVQSIEWVREMCKQEVEPSEAFRENSRNLVPLIWAGLPGKIAHVIESEAPFNAKES
jgi:hypothetical protein